MNDFSTEDKSLLCEALGLDPNKVVGLNIRIYPKASMIEATVKVEPTPEACGVLTDLVKKYALKVTRSEED